MSLIDEALKRARADAARRSATERSAASRWVPSQPLTRRRRRPLLWAGLAAGCLAAGVAVGLAVAGLSGGASEEGRGGRAARERAVVEAPATVEEKDQVRRHGSGPLAGEPAAGTRGAPRLKREVPDAARRVNAPPPPSSSSAPAAPPASEPPADRSPSSPPSPSSTAPPAAETPAASAPPPEEPAPAYVRRAQLPGGGQIVLGGIAFSTNPVALLNGKVVGVGEVVDGMTVVAIAPGRVDLEGRGTRLALLIK